MSTCDARNVDPVIARVRLVEGQIMGVGAVFDSEAIDAVRVADGTSTGRYFLEGARWGGRSTSAYAKRNQSRASGLAGGRRTSRGN